MSKRKQLHGIARNAAHQFSNSAEHFSFLAAHAKQKIISIDLITGKITPVEFEIPRNTNLVNMVMYSLHRSLLQFQRTTITRAVITIEFNPEIISPLFIQSAKFTTILTDADGNEWKGYIDTRPQLISS